MEAKAEIYPSLHHFFMTHQIFKLPFNMTSVHCNDKAAHKKQRLTFWTCWILEALILLTVTFKIAYLPGHIHPQRITVISMFGCYKYKRRHRLTITMVIDQGHMSAVPMSSSPHAQGYYWYKLKLKRSMNENWQHHLTHSSSYSKYHLFHQVQNHIVTWIQMT